MHQVIVASGHLVDAPDRPVPRFPQERVPWVTGQIEAVFDEWQVGPSTTLICGGARGADIIAAEAALARGAHVVVCLALPPDRFVEQSVDLPGTDWAARFRRLLEVADVRELRDPPAGDEVFTRTNEWMVDLARSLHPEPRAVLVWNGQAGDGVGGTAHMVHRLGYDRDDPRVRVIDPTP
ncbi:hypothetical protein [Virgisporangium aurantiacum]|uniref:DUF1273 family protein n=1 Tax=Virgisporangium aurantiacum TaxID=175570 RepID=A0A8J3Z4T9_9ACTN|nr:hypothetical protein [Virgisporangium aurantiacum]GIJ57329.1 hypothetical protein Vau01_048450 [Virgisporangium aurantiacum]